MIPPPHGGDGFDALVDGKSAVAVRSDVADVLIDGVEELAHGHRLVQGHRYQSSNAQRETGEAAYLKVVTIAQMALVYRCAWDRSG